MSESGESNIVIKKAKKGGHGGHHGGAWKVAYADFVTAMMAFFLLLWLLNATTEEQKRGIADYFSPTPGAIQSTSGGEGIFSGTSITSEGFLIEDQSAIGVTVVFPEETQQEDEGPESEVALDDPSDSETPQEEPEAEERRQLEQAERDLREAIETNPELEDLADNLLIDQTPEGLRIQIVDREGTPMYKRGIATMTDEGAILTQQVIEAVISLENRVAITGHTDATRYRRFGYDNWDLSTDRANSSRRAMIRGGLDPERVYRVSGRGSNDPLDIEDPTAPINRRISVVLLRDSWVEQQEKDEGNYTAASDLEENLSSPDVSQNALEEALPEESPPEESPLQESPLE